MACGCMMDAVLFLSTLSLRRATKLLWYLPLLYPISIHALLAESDETREAVEKLLDEFLSTLSLRRATTSAVLR